MQAIADQRNIIRREKLRQRDAIIVDDRKAFSQRIAERVLSIFGDHVLSVHSYLNHRSEVETLPLLETLLKKGLIVMAPVVNPAEDGTHTLEHWHVRDLSDLVKGQYEISQPRNREVADPRLANSILVPLAAFDRAGNRLGYGKGYYDRFLAQFPAPVRIGLAFECQETGSIPHEPHDQVLDIIITETEVITTGARGLDGA
jgi:5-formyltetrahydrofolate cyclo-ligase